MSLLRRLFGGGAGNDSTRAGFAAIEYKGYDISPDPQPEGGQWRLSAIISAEVGGELLEHRLIRADILPTAELAAEFAVQKAIQMIDQQGTKLFDRN